MNLIDIVVVIVVGAALVRGARVGAAALMLAYAGFFAGLVAGSIAAPFLSRLFPSPMAKIVVGLASPLIGGGLGACGGQYLGSRTWAWLRQARLGHLDAAVGSFVSGVASLLSVWLVGFLLAAGPWGTAAREIQGSIILRRLDRTLPSPPSVLARIQRLLDRSNLPLVFAALEPNLAGPVPLPNDQVVRGALERAGASTVRIVGPGCGGVVEGSGFVAGAGLVVTNAHVVAGVARPIVEDGGGRRPATAVLFDPELDLAVLRTTHLTGPALALSPGSVPRGAVGAILGYPGGGPLRGSAAAVRRTFVAVGRDIYGRNVTARSVYELEARVRPGNSGGPLLAPDGRVLGVVFSRSVRQPDVGYALVADDVASRVRAASTRGTPVGTGSCAA